MNNYKLGDVLEGIIYISNNSTLSPTTLIMGNNYYTWRAPLPTYEWHYL